MTSENPEFHGFSENPESQEFRNLEKKESLVFINPTRDGTRFPLYNEMPGDEDIHLSCIQLLKTHLEQTNQHEVGIYEFKFPGVDDKVASIYWDILISMERRFPIQDYFTNSELRRIVRAIDNHDYVKDAYPDNDVGWHGLLLDTGIFRAIAGFKMQHYNPCLVGIERVCTALSLPMPKHLYYLKFKLTDGTFQTVSFRSGDELLENVDASDIN